MSGVPIFRPRRIAHAFYNPRDVGPYLEGNTQKEIFLMNFCDTALGKWVEHFPNYKPLTSEEVRYEKPDGEIQKMRFKKTDRGFQISPGGEVDTDILLIVNYPEDSEASDFNDALFWRKYKNLLKQVYSQLPQDFDMLACFLTGQDPEREMLYFERLGIWEDPTARKVFITQSATPADQQKAVKLQTEGYKLVSAETEAAVEVHVGSDGIEKRTALIIERT